MPANPKKWLYSLAVAAALVAAGWMYGQNLGRPELIMWDEAVHVNVIRNLSERCCVMTLLPEKLDTDFRNWTDNHVWLHKPPLPFYIAAGLYRLLGSDPLAARLPAAFAAVAAAAAMFLIGKKFLHPLSGLIAAGLFAANPYVFELVQGRQFSGASDLWFAFFATLCLGLIWMIVRRPRRLWFIAFGLTAALAYFSKGGLAFIPFGVLAASLFIFARSKDSLAGAAWAALAFLLPVAPEIAYLAWRFPAEFAYEQQVQINHLFADIEHWGRPWDYYFTVYWPSQITPYLLPAILASLAKALLSGRRRPELLIAAIWVLAFLLPLSFGVSKISNFIFAALPAALLLLAENARQLWATGKTRVLTAWGLSAVAAYAVLRLDFAGIKSFIPLADPWPLRLTPLLLAAACLAAAAAVSQLLPSRLLRRSAVLAAAAALFLTLWSFGRQNLASAWQPYPHAVLQADLRQTAQQLNRQLPHDAIVLIDAERLKHSNLFYLYWSDYPALEVYFFHPVWFLLQRLPAERPIYLAADRLRPELGRPDQEIPLGWLYRLR